MFPVLKRKLGVFLYLRENWMFSLYLGPEAHGCRRRTRGDSVAEALGTTPAAFSHHPYGGFLPVLLKNRTIATLVKINLKFDRVV